MSTETQLNVLAPQARQRVLRWRRWCTVVLLVALTVAAVIAATVWVPGAFASPSGGCGG